MATFDESMTATAGLAAAMEPVKVRDDTLSSAATSADSVEAVSMAVVTMTSTGTVSSAMVVDAVVPAEMLSSAAMGSAFNTQLVLNAIMASLATSGSVIGVPESDGDTWVVNLDTTGSTTYSNYPFNSYARFGGRYYGAGPGGLYLLEGDTDEDEPIRANISFGQLDFGTATKKTVSQCYVGVSSGGNLFLKVIAEGREYVYRTRSASPEMQQQRVTFGKGLRTNYVTLELYNEDGADFELDTVEFQVADMTRRI